MRKSILYSGYMIESAPFQSADSPRWQVLIRIWGKSSVLTKKWVFSMEGNYLTQEEADLHGIAYGQRIIEGKVPGVFLEQGGVDGEATSATTKLC